MKKWAAYAKEQRSTRSESVDDETNYERSHASNEPRAKYVLANCATPALEIQTVEVPLGFRIESKQ